MATDDSVDELFRGPLDGFTAARDALAKSAGPAGAEIRKLQKPTAPAWAVNQVYWRRRAIFDRLATAADRLRTAHGRRLSGKDADLGVAERTHDAAVQAATEEARRFLANAGDPVTPATIMAVAETFRAFPWPEPPGRIRRPQRLMGFEALAGLLPKGAATKPLANIVAIDRARRDRAGRRATEQDAERAAADERRELASTQSALRVARTEAEKAERGVAAARRGLAAAEAERDRLSRRLEDVATRVRELKDALGGDVRQSAAASAEVARLEARVRFLSGRAT